MARGKQAHPQHVQSSGSCTEEKSVDDGDHTSLDTADRHHYCEELGALSDVKPHKRFYSSHPHVLQVLKERGTSAPTYDYHVHCVSSTTFREMDGCAKTFETGDHIPQGSPGQPEDNMVFENCSRCSSNDRISNSSSTHASSGEQQQTDIPVSTSALALASLTQSGSFSPPELCQWRNTSVTIENLQSTKVAVAQFSQQTQEDDCHIGTGTTTVSSLLEQILALQVQQIHQLKLTNQICHQVLLFASEKLNISESPVSCDQEPSASKSTAPIIDLSCNLSQQLAIAAHTAQCLATQSGNVTEFKKLISQQHSLGSESFHSDSLLKKLMTLRYQQWFSTAEYAQAGSPNPKCNDVPCTKRPSLAFGKNSLVNKSSNILHFTQSNNQLQINCDPMINIVTSVAEEKNHIKSMNITLSEPKASLNNGFFKRRCRFCGKLFGSDSALQIHMRSHTGERPYKCNICGNRFSTRGNLKVHFQRHKKRYPHITMNPYPVPQHLDNIPTSTGITYGMSMLPEKPSTRWIHSKLCADKTTTSSGIQSLGCMKQPSFVKQEQSFSPSSSCSQNVVHLASNVKTTMPTDSAHTVQGSVITMDCNNEEKASLNVMFEMKTSTQEESKGRVSDDISSSCAHPNSGTAIPLLRSSDTSKLQLLLEDIDKKVSDSYDCVLCHRRLSCHSALRTHYRTHITGERPYLCKPCGRAFSSIANLRNHQAIHHAASTWRAPLSCPICQKKFTNNLMLQQHVHLHTGGNTYVAPLLNQNISRPTGCNGGPLNKRHNTHVSLDFSEDSVSNFRSSLSSSMSSSVSGVSRCDDHSVICYGLSQPNWIKEEGEQDPTEEGCPAYNLPTLDNLCPNSQPLCYLNSEGPFQTQVSSTTLKFIEPSIKLSDIDLFNQIKDTPISSPGLYEKGIFKNAACDLCGKNFVCQSALDIHYRTHTKERPFLCATCNRGFSTKGNLKQHTLTHQMRAILTPSHLFEPLHANKTSTVDDPALCSMPPLFKREETACPCSPPTSGNHQSKRVAPVLSWSSVGGASSALCSAVPLRCKAKQHHCRTCGKTFSSSSALQIHNRTHTGEKPFACNVCLRAFTTKGNLKVHMGTHVWNSASTRKGRRLLNGSLVPLASSPVILPALPQMNPVTPPSKLGESVYSRNQYTGPLPLARGMRTNDISAVQRKEVCYLSGPTGLKERPPVGDLSVTLDKLL